MQRRRDMQTFTDVSSCFAVCVLQIDAVALASEAGPGGMESLAKSSSGPRKPAHRMGPTPACAVGCRHPASGPASERDPPQMAHRPTAASANAETSNGQATQKALHGTFRGRRLAIAPSESAGPRTTWSSKNPTARRTVTGVPRAAACK